MMGQVVGTAAGMALQHNTTPRGACYKHITDLQQMLLRDGCYLMGVKNEDPQDLAMGAKVTASSHGTSTFAHSCSPATAATSPREDSPEWRSRGGR